MSRIVSRTAELDESLYAAVARRRSSPVDGPIAWVSNAANGGGLWIAIAAVIAVAGRRRGRATAVRGLAALGGASAVANLAVKPSVSRRRPERVAAPSRDRVSMPRSSSFPSGHTATAFGFASCVSADYPVLAVPLLGLAAVVGYSRVHAGVHYPADVVGGAVLGSAVGLLIRRATLRLGPTWLPQGG